MVYDLRVMKVMNPVQLLIEPCFIHYIPMCSSVVAIASQVSGGWGSGQGSFV